MDNFSYHGRHFDKLRAFDSYRTNQKSIFTHTKTRQMTAFKVLIHSFKVLPFCTTPNLRVTYFIHSRVFCLFFKIDNLLRFVHKKSGNRESWRKMHCSKMGAIHSRYSFFMNKFVVNFSIIIRNDWIFIWNAIKNSICWLKRIEEQLTQYNFQWKRL